MSIVNFTRLKKTTMAELPLLIIENILLRLPVKSLIRSRCVCKAWRTLISHPHFVKSHLRLPQTQARTQFCTLNYGEPGDNYYLVVGASTKDCEAFSDDNGGALAFDYLFDIGRFKYEVVLLDSCDGLLCLVDLANKIVLWNPSTRQWNQLPPNPNVLDFLGCHGFGYDSFADDYKVFVVSMLNPNFETVVDVFSLKSNKWKRIQEKHHTRAARMCATVLHGALHWVAYDPILGFDTIMAFDFEKERFREMAIPREEEELYVKLRVVGGCLCVHGSKDPSKMWVMKEYGVDTSWSKMASPYNSLRNNLNEEFRCELLHTLNNEHMLLVNKEKLMLCDQKENTYKNIMPYGRWFRHDANLYVETLNILLRLPVKSLLYCKYVCKAWYAMISHPQFAKAHLQLPQTQAKTRLCIINFEEEKMMLHWWSESPLKIGSQLVMVTAIDVNLKHSVHLLNSCDGLLCLVDGLGKIVLWNPSTRQYNPLPPNANGPKCIGVSRLGFETVVDVFSLKSHKWRRIEKKHHTEFKCSWRNTVLHGAVHWIAYDLDVPDPTVVAFDFEKEEFRQMTIPRDESSRMLTVIGGCLCTPSGRDSSKMWVMKEYGVEASWTRMDSPYLDENFKCQPLNNQVKLWVNEEPLVVLFDVLDKRCIKYAANLFVESLVPPYPSQNE
ncbi:hypothetical protein AAG906_039715 [Vitis piasezkii]